MRYDYEFFPRGLLVHLPHSGVNSWLPVRFRLVLRLVSNILTLISFNSLGRFAFLCLDPCTRLFVRWGSLAGRSVVMLPIVYIALRFSDPDGVFLVLPAPVSWCPQCTLPTRAVSSVVILALPGAKSLTGIIQCVKGGLPHLRGFHSVIESVGPGSRLLYVEGHVAFAVHVHSPFCISAIALL